MSKSKTGETPPRTSETPQAPEKSRGKSGETPQASERTRHPSGETRPPSGETRHPSGESPTSDTPRHRTGEFATHIFGTRDAHKVLLDSLDNVSASLDEATVARKVEIGSVLWDIDERIGEVLAKIKESLRIEAQRRLDGRLGNCTIDGDDLGEVSVRVLEAALRVPRGKNIEDIKRALGPEFFGLFFEEVTTYKPRAEYEERVLAVQNPLHRQILLNCIERVEQTPRVAFRRARPKKA
jgi:hypothetical protein